MNRINLTNDIRLYCTDDKMMNNTGPRGAHRSWWSQVEDVCFGQLPQIWLQQLIISLQPLEPLNECSVVAQILRLLGDNCGFAPGPRKRESAQSTLLLEHRLKRQSLPIMSQKSSGTKEHKLYLSLPLIF